MYRTRIRILVLVAAVVLSAVAAMADVAIQDGPVFVEEPELRVGAYRGKYHTVTESGDSVLMIVLRDVTVYPPLKFKNKKQEEFYWRTVRDVKRTLPYAKLICETLIETYEYIETLPTQKDREEHLKAMETEVFNQYKPILKHFTRSQARLLVKLIQRETNQTSYDILKAFLGSFRAGFWQTFGRFFGVNLKGTYNPGKDKNDAIIERVCVAVEQGLL